MIKVTLKELYKDVFRRSTLISIPNLSEFFEIPESDFTNWEVFYSIVRSALDEFEYYYPLSLVQKLEINVSENRIATLTDNFEDYLSDLILEKDIVILPDSIQGLSLGGFGMTGQLLRGFRYEVPELREFFYTSGTYYADTLCKRPLIEDYDEKSKLPTDRCAIYYLSKGTAQYKIFRDQLYLSLCRYILNMKKNLDLSDLPITLFQGLEEDQQKLESKLDNIYSNALTSSPWLL